MRRVLVAIVVLALVGVGGYQAIGLLTGAGDSVVALAKVEGWREDLGTPLPPFAVIEIAFDRQAAERAWADNVPADLPVRDGAPEQPGVYGDLQRVDFDEQVVVVWSSGESSSFPGWLADIGLGDDGILTVERDDVAGRFGACTDDFVPYRMLVAVDRGRVPGPDELPTDEVAGVPAAGALIDVYPAQS